jgi:hypothetical protein
MDEETISEIIELFRDVPQPLSGKREKVLKVK